MDVLSRYLLPKVMYDQPAECEENDCANPKDPFVLLRPPLNHPDRVAAYSQRVCHTVQLLLCSFQQLSLFA